jgi:hypothetical protein
MQMPLNILVQFLPLAVFLISCPLVIFAILDFHRLVEIEYKQFPDAWAADGKPYFSRQRLHNVRFRFLSGFAANRCSFVWLFVTPRWARDHAEASYYLHQLRVLVALWNFAAMPLFILSAVIAMAFGG